MSGIEIIMSLVSALSLSEKLQLNAALATSMAGKEVSSRKGKPAAPGTKAWTAFVTHVQSTMPERFASAPPKDRMIIAKAIKDEDPEAYKAFAAKYVAEHPASETASVASDAEQAASEPIPYVDWGSAPAQAALRAEKAKKADTAANVVISPYALDSKLTVGKAPSADEYQPPSVFLKQMEAPDPKKKNDAMGGVLADLWKL
jgi:hypothetical protein